MTTTTEIYHGVTSLVSETNLTTQSENHSIYESWLLYVPIAIGLFIAFIFLLVGLMKKFKSHLQHLVCTVGKEKPAVPVVIYNHGLSALCTTLTKIEDGTSAALVPLCIELNGSQQEDAQSSEHDEAKVSLTLNTDDSSVHLFNSDIQHKPMRGILVAKHIPSAAGTMRVDVGLGSAEPFWVNLNLFSLMEQ